MASTSQTNFLSKKRRFQPPITSYFAASTTADDDSGVSHHSYAAPTNTPTPALSANILSSLLGVGARVRKSVPEGYKTQQKKLTAYTIAAPTPSTQSGVSSQSTRPTTTTTVYAELEPFCGFHKIGNHAVQTFPRPDEEYRNEMMMNVDDLEAPSIPSSSQESNASFASSSSLYVHPNNKRAFDSDIEEYDDESIMIHHDKALYGDIWQDTTTLRAPPSNYTSSPSIAISQRTILSPKLSQHRRRIITSQNNSTPWKTHYSEQENGDPHVAREMMDLDDFGEAAFLRRKEELDADYM